MLKEIKESAKSNKVFGYKITKAIKSNPELLQQIIDETKFLNAHYEYIPLNQRLFHIWNNINHVEICPFCGKVVEIYFTSKPEPLKSFRNYRTICGSKDCRKKFKIRNSLEKYGVESPNQVDEIKLKQTATLFKNYGVAHTSQSKIIKDRRKATLIKKYGVENPLQSKIIKEKFKSTCVKRYGVENAMQSKEFRDKAKTTCMKRYGVENPSNVKIFRDKANSTCVKRYGVENAMQSKEFRDKAKTTCMKRYGVENPNQSVEIFSKQNKYKRKIYILPSEKIIKLQGYEPFYLNEYFVNGGLEENVQCEKIKVIPYFLNGEKHTYHPDFYLKNEHKIIEVKSVWTFKKDLEENLMKRRACIEQGFDFEFFIYDKKGNRLSEEELINKS